MSLLSVRGVRKRWNGNGLPTLDGIQFDMEAGQVAYLLGANGAGKTTLCDILSGHLAPDDGAVELGGRALARMPLAVLASTVAYITQNTSRALLPEQSVLENALLCDEMSGWRMPLFFPKFRARRRVSAFLAQVVPALAGKLDQPVGSLSGGERQILAVVLACRRRPMLLLLDEPTSALDGEVRGRISDLIGEVRGVHRPATIVVTHSLDEALARADRLLLLRGGRLVADLPRGDPRWTVDGVRAILWVEGAPPG